MTRLRAISLIAWSGLMIGCLAEAFAQPNPAHRVVTAGAKEARSAVPARDFDVLQADAFIRDVFSSLDVAQYAAAAQAYLTLLAQLDRPLTTAEQTILLKHLSAVAMILSPAERAEVGLGEALAQDDPARLVPGSGARLAQWWRSQDPLPATPDNERLEEHLTRVMVATQQYTSEHDERGFDDRGEVYVRLGAPSHSTSVEISDADLLIHPLVSKLPQNVFWVYQQVGHDAHYFFIQQTPNQPFHLGYPTDLIPSELRNGRRKTSLLLHVMEEVFAQLALQHADYGLYYDEVANYRTLPSRDAGPPHLFALRTYTQAQREDRQHEGSRRETVPPFYTATGLAPPLPVPMRWARFLDPDGTTRTEIYWSLEGRALQPSRRQVRRLRKAGHTPSESYLVSLAVAQRTADYHTRAIHNKHYLVPVDAEAALPTQSLVVYGDTATYHLAVQWDQRWTRADEERPEALVPGARLKRHTQRLDTLQALHSLGRALEMSDLKPLLRSQGAAPETDTPYPYATLTATTPLALYFELYHLTFGADDQTHYRIDYEVARSAMNSGVLRLPGRRDEQRTAAQTTVTGTSRTARERLALDLSAWKGRGNVDITIRATDETTGAQVARTITFFLENDR